MKKMINSNQLILEDGRLECLGFNMMMLPAFTWTKIVERLYEEVGEEAFEVLFEVGKEHGEYAIQKVGRDNNVSKRQFIDQSMHTANVLGIGKFNAERLDPDKGELVYTVEDSPFKEEFENSEVLKDVKGPIDYLHLGIGHSVGKILLDGEVESKETKCIFEGDQKCRFVVKRK